MNRMRGLFSALVGSALLLALCSGFSSAAVPDDSSLFMEAFNAFQKKDYLLVIEKVDQLNKIFPDTPLRDLSLLFLARAGYYSGDNELAARTINQFNAEFSDNSLKNSVEDELLVLGAKLKKGEKLPPNKQLRTAAQKVRNDQIALERAAALKAEQERLALEKAERERIAREKAEAERREQERLAAEKAAKESIRLAIVLPQEKQSFEVNTEAVVPFELVNRGTGREEFLVSVTPAGGIATALRSVAKPSESVQRVALEPGEVFKGNVVLRIPADKVDGFNKQIPLRAVSAKYNDVAFAGDLTVAASAPLIRAIAKPDRQKIGRDDTFGYRVAVLNAGSLAARDLTVTVSLPSQLDIVDASGAEYLQKSPGVVAFKLNEMNSGQLKDLNVNVKVRDGVENKQELRCKVEVLNGALNLKEAYLSAPAIFEGK